MFNYFYKIINKLNGKFYFGVHKTYNLDDGYMGSGKRLIYAKEKYGIENFKKEIIEFFDTYEEALKLEEFIVNEELISNNDCYNLKIGGGSGWEYVNRTKILTESMRKHLSNIGKWKNKEKRLKILESIPMEKRKKIGKKLGDKFGGQNKLSNYQIKERLNLIENIDLTKWGWVKKVSEKLNLTHTQSRRFIDKYYKEEVYKRK
jgi:hypothetical protein